MLALKRKTVIQWVLWLAYFVLIYALYSARLTTGDSILVAAIIFIFHFGLFHFNYSLLMPQFYFNNKRVLYFTLIILGLVVVVILGKLVIDYFYEMEFARQGIENRKFNRPTKSVSFMIFRILPILFPAITVVFVSSILRSSEMISRKEKEMSQLQAENLNAELKMLRSQINPHFLFNALNNIYSMAIDNASNTADVILKFSQMMRYMIYESNVDKVPLNSEIEFLRNYIDIHKLKDEKIENIKFQYVESELGISPMILLPFVENAFKHSQIEDIQKGWIDIFLDLDASKLTFKVSNSKPPTSTQKDKTGGIGIENVKKRLKLLYPDKHQLIFNEDNEKFEVSLEILLT
ncbi:MAG: sensor histidine kinase [Cyclobacteriaceae bacterium]|nr:sensor histidine kinase [Cyclobacteriaceae bacterium]